MIFKNIYGKINSVSLSSYEELVSLYVDKVKDVKGVKSIIQIGSYTTPGLSDIDIIVIVDNDNPPNWEEISIKKICRESKAFEVIAHDVFVYPEYMAKYIEGLFYINRKVLLYGEDIGEELSIEKIDELKLLLSFEYTIHRLESIVAYTSLARINVRDILLFISTLRHTYKLLSDFDIITPKECKDRIQKIEDLRNSSIDNTSYEFRKTLNEWIIPSYRAIYDSALLLGEKLNYEHKSKNTSWILNNKKMIHEIDDVNEAVQFFIKNDSFNKRLKGRILIEAMPSFVATHVNNYKNFVPKKIADVENMDAVFIRYHLANEHKNFIRLNKYPISTSYIIIEEGIPRIQDKIKELFLKVISIFWIFK